jgi:hypothetical protein
MEWAHDEIADNVLIREVRRRFEEGTLPEAVVIVSGDSDFVPLVRMLKESGHVTLFVSAHRRTAQEYRDASWWLHLRDVILQHPPHRRAFEREKKLEISEAERALRAREDPSYIQPALPRFTETFAEMVAKWKKEQGIT